MPYCSTIAGNDFMNAYAVIMAGGGGTRFWPLSRVSEPKQLLNLSGKDVMINETIARVKKVVSDENSVYVVTNAAQAGKTVAITKGKIPPVNVLSEPLAKNTAACIGYAAAKILKERGDGVIIVTPSDAYVKNEEKYAELLRSAVSAAESEDCIVTVGVVPTFPATGYGYIKYEISDNPVKSVISFVEKPDEKTAGKYLESGDYVWNCGVFVWKASVIMDNIKKYLPELYDGLMRIYAAVGTPEEAKTVSEVYPALPSVSIDYGVMEKAENIKVVTGEFGWNDVGSWDMMGVLHRADENRNVIVGDAVVCGTKNSTIYSSGRTIAVLGMDGVVVAETPDAVLVCPREKAQDIKKIIESLKASGRTELL